MPEAKINDLPKAHKLPSEPQVKIILDKFDFDKVAATMTLLGWRWLGAKQSPAPDEIRAQAIRLLNIVVDEDVRSATTGGLLVTCSPQGQLKLMFVLERAEDYWAFEDAREESESYAGPDDYEDNLCHTNVR